MCTDKRRFIDFQRSIRFGSQFWFIDSFSANVRLLEWHFSTQHSTTHEDLSSKLWNKHGNKINGRKYPFLSERWLISAKTPEKDMHDCRCCCWDNSKVFEIFCSLFYDTIWYDREIKSALCVWVGCSCSFIWIISQWVWRKRLLLLRIL